MTEIDGERLVGMSIAEREYAEFLDTVRKFLTLQDANLRVHKHLVEQQLAAFKEFLDVLREQDREGRHDG